MFEASEVLDLEEAASVRPLAASAKLSFVQSVTLTASAAAISQRCASMVGERGAVGRPLRVPSLHGSGRRLVRASLDASAVYGRSESLAPASQSSTWSRRSQPNEAFEPTPECNATFGGWLPRRVQRRAAFGVRPHRGAAQQRR
jgi:hypothetical protein